MLRRGNLLLMSLCLLVTLVSCDSKDIEKEARRKEKERIEQKQKEDEEARRKKEEEEKRKKEEERKKRLQDIVGIYKGKRNGEDWFFEVKWYDYYNKRLNVSGHLFYSSWLKLSSEQEDLLVFSQQDAISVVCRFFLDQKQLNIVYKELNTGLSWEFEGTRQ